MENKFSNDHDNPICLLELSLDYLLPGLGLAAVDNKASNTKYEITIYRKSETTKMRNSGQDHWAAWLGLASIP
eukprot:scaffold9485_cov248-Ochromonas_danica.AAC.2